MRVDMRVVATTYQGRSVNLLHFFAWGEAEDKGFDVCLFGRGLEVRLTPTHSRTSASWDDGRLDEYAVRALRPRDLTGWGRDG